MTPNFDLHCHPSFKPMLKPANRMSCWDSVKVDADFISGNIFDSQSNLEQLLKGNVNLAVVALHSLEMAFAKQWLLKDVLSRFSKKYVDENLMTSIANAHKPYYETLNEEVTNLLANVNHSDNGVSQSIKIINSITEYNKDDLTTLHIILAVEGGHCFFEDTNLGMDETILLNRLSEFKNKHRLLYITFTHLSQSTLCNHCFGIKIFSRNDFMPVGNLEDGKKNTGITQLGKKFIREVFQPNNNGQRTFIDIKHMSLQSRIDYYQLRRDEAEFYHGTPIIASHVGVNGISYKNISDTINCTVFNEAKYYFKIVYNTLIGHIKDAHFNPISINLYDEDIQEILKSDGLIGLSIDERILGIETMKGSRVNSEFIAYEDIGLFVTKEVKKYHLDHELSFEHDEDEEAEEMNYQHTPSDAVPSPIKLLVNTILHIVKTGHPILGDSSWEHITMGSDFDGLVNPIDNCMNMVQYNDLRQSLANALRDGLAEMNQPLPMIRGINFNETQLADLILFENAQVFLKKYFI